METESGKKSGRGRGRGRGRGGRGSRGARGGRGATRGKAATGRGRAKKMVIESDEEEQIETSEIVDNQVDISDEADDHDEEMVIDERENTKPDTEEKTEISKPSPPPEKRIEKVEISKPSPEKRSEKVEFTIDDDISQLVPPTFSTVSKGPSSIMLELSWDQKYTPIGERLPSPNVHMCIGCKLPIRIYGRLIQCKHVFCHSCATKQTQCMCCKERVIRVESAHLGQVFMCNHDGARYGFDGCRRTYLSQRDLQAHINHRHKPRNSGGNDHHSVPISPGSSITSSHQSSSTASYDHGNSSSSSHYSRQNIPVHYSSARGNLISVPLQAGSNSSTRPQSQGAESSQPTGNRYERKSSFNRNTSWSSYNNRQF